MDISVMFSNCLQFLGTMFLNILSFLDSIYLTENITMLTFSIGLSMFGLLLLLVRGLFGGSSDR